MAQVTVVGAWMDLELRKLVPPPHGLAEALQAMARSDPFADLPAIRKK
jgi:hypothetical protein